MELVLKSPSELSELSDLTGPSVRLMRHPERGSHERAEVYAIIDEAVLAHVAFDAGGTPMTLPTAHARIDDQLYVHGALSNRMLRTLCEAERASATFTLVDGLVLARTAFHHSMNFRSAVVFGRAREVVELDEKQLALHALVEHLAPGRMAELSRPTEAELRKTSVLCIAIEEASAKVRAGDPLDPPAHLEFDVWAGVVPIALAVGAPVPDAKLRAGQAVSRAAVARAGRSAV
jgi:nitroimidazol reductase NimA-like FMN-containing flavoprotein (pyridoxamine 5'-phosphate oxidase superfamily)